MASVAALPALPLPSRDKVRAFTSQEALDRWGDDTAQFRALERGDNVITMFDVIGEDWSGAGITAKSVASQLRAIGGPVEVQMNSPGGDVFEGFAIYNVLREHPYPVNVKIVGMAASAASVIAMAGDNIQIGSAAFVMIHNCWCLGIGNRHDFAELAAFLAPFDEALAGVYHVRTGKTVAEIQKWMDAETYMSGQLAIDRGFADELLPADQVVEDHTARAETKKVNEVRSMEMALLAQGMSRTQARARIQSLKAGHSEGAAPGEGSGQASIDAAATQQFRSILSELQDMVQ